MSALDLGDLCTHCGEDTSPGSGRWVNRIPSDSTVEVVLPFGSHSLDLEVTGYMCAECQAEDECEVCGTYACVNGMGDEPCDGGDDA